MASIVVRPEGQLARPLSVLVPLIKEDLEAAGDASRRAGMPYYKAAGEKLIEAKTQVARGEFMAWIKRNFTISVSHAERYMSFARATSDIENPRFENFSEFMRTEGGDAGYGRVVRKRGWHEDVKENIERAKREADRIRNEILTRQQQREADQKLALRVIDIGFKVLAKELHPDRGGSSDAMSRLNRVRDHLRQHA